MKKTLSIFKYEFTNLRRSKFLYVVILLFGFGFQQIFSTLTSKGGVFQGGLISLFKTSWLPLNFIMIPILLISSNMGKSDNEIINIMNINIKNKVIGKWIVLLIIDAFILFVYFMIFQTAALLFGVSLSYYLYLLKGFLALILITLLTLNSIGYLTGLILKESIFRYIFLIVIFLVLCSFYKGSSSMLVLFNLPSLGSSFMLFKFNSLFIMHKLFWILVSFTLIVAMLILEYRKMYKKINKLLCGAMIPMLITTIFVCVKGYSMQPTYYEQINKQKELAIVKQWEKQYDKNQIYKSQYHTFSGMEDGAYFINRYDMQVDLAEKFKNKCDAYINITSDGVKEITLGLFGKLNIDYVMINDKKAEFERDFNSFTVKLEKQLKKGDKIKLSISYGGLIYTSGPQGKDLFFADNSSAFLADVFEWYPKLNDNFQKEYNISLKHDNKIYSNLKSTVVEGKYTLKGSAEEIFILSGNLVEKKYKGFTLVGNEEYFKTDKQCEKAVNYVKKAESSNALTFSESIDTIIFTPMIDYGGEGYKYPYNNVYLEPFSDVADKITTKIN